MMVRPATAAHVTAHTHQSVGTAGSRDQRRWHSKAGRQTCPPPAVPSNLPSNLCLPPTCKRLEHDAHVPVGADAAHQDREDEREGEQSDQVPRVLPPDSGAAHEGDEAHLRGGMGWMDGQGAEGGGAGLRAYRQDSRPPRRCPEAGRRSMPAASPPLPSQLSHSPGTRPRRRRRATGPRRRAGRRPGGREGRGGGARASRVRSRQRVCVCGSSTQRPHETPVHSTAQASP